MQLKIESLLSEIPAQILLNNNVFETEDLCFHVFAYHSIEELIQDLPEDKQLVLLENANSIAFCIKYANIILINYEKFNDLNFEEKMFVIAHEYCHLLYPAYDEIGVDSEAIFILKKMKLDLSKIRLENMLESKNTFYDERIEFFNKHHI